MSSANVKSKNFEINKLPSTIRAFSAAEKWTVRSTGVGGLISRQNGKPVTLETLESFS